MNRLLTGIMLGLFMATAPLTTVAAPAPALPIEQKARLIVLTDMENEPDDKQSLVRLLLYSNEIDIEGIVATTSVHMRRELHPESIRFVIGQYGKVQPNLLKHAAGYPTAETLLARVYNGQPGYGVEAIGAGKDSDGSRLIISALESDDPRPLWVTAWGGVNTLAQALHTIRETKPPAEAARLMGKLRVYTISDQDDSGIWIRRNFPEVFYIVSPGGYGAGTWTGILNVIDGIDNTTISNAWLAEHIQQGHGPLGAAYPDVAYGMEGDTPSFLNLIPNGLNTPERPDFGGWGGRYVLRIPKHEELDLNGFNGGIVIEEEPRPIWTNSNDVLKPYVPGEYGRSVRLIERTFDDYRATVWRWRDAFQNDFAARMDWTTRSYQDANHPPVVVLAHPDRLTAKSGETVMLSAMGSHDPDGDSLTYIWFNYAEAGTLNTPIPPNGAENIFRVGFTLPKVTKAETAHFIVMVTDKGSPALTRYGRVIVTIVP